MGVHVTCSSQGLGITGSSVFCVLNGIARWPSREVILTFILTRKPEENLFSHRVLTVADLQNKGKELWVISVNFRVLSTFCMCVCGGHFLSLGWEPLCLQGMPKERGRPCWRRRLCTVVKVCTSRQASPGLIRQEILQSQAPLPQQAPVPHNRACLLALLALALVREPGAGSIWGLKRSPLSYSTP